MAAHQDRNCSVLPQATVALCSPDSPAWQAEFQGNVISPLTWLTWGQVPAHVWKAPCREKRALEWGAQSHPGHALGEETGCGARLQPIPAACHPLVAHLGAAPLGWAEG